MESQKEDQKENPVNGIEANKAKYNNRSPLTNSE